MVRTLVGVGIISGNKERELLWIVFGNVYVIEKKISTRSGVGERRKVFLIVDGL